MQLDRLRPRDEWYLHNPVGIHGLGHAARVLVWAERVADGMEKDGVRVDRDVVRCAAMVHDVRRVDDGRDGEHGERAAAWLEAGGVELPVALTPAQLEAVAYCCRWHVPSDGACPEMTAELRCLKDGDGLDRVRIYDLNPAYLRNAAARRLAGRAQELLERSVGGSGDPWDRVRAAAVEMGLWR